MKFNKKGQVAITVEIDIKQQSPEQAISCKLQEEKIV